MKYVSVFTLLLCLFFSSNAATFTVSNTQDSGPGSLRQAIMDANNAFGPDNIYFNIPQTDPHYSPARGVWSIQLVSELPMISGGFTNIDASTQTTNQGNQNPYGPEVELQGYDTLNYAFRIVSPSNTVKGFIIGRFESGFQLYGTYCSGCVIEENYIGVQSGGNSAFPNLYGIAMTAGATQISILNNLISGSSVVGIGAIQCDNISIKGNKIGTNHLGLTAIPNAVGIGFDNTHSCLIGDSVSQNGNLISGNTDAGIAISNPQSANNLIIGNTIGLNSSGTDSLGNWQGVVFLNAGNNIIGGKSLSKQNVISGNTSAGIVINGTGADNNLIIGNKIGTDSAGLNPLGNFYGVIIKGDANTNKVGDGTAEGLNVISANYEIGVYIEASDSNEVLGNFIGPDITGQATFKENDTAIQANGVEINTFGKHNYIGKYSIPEPLLPNTISGNRVYGAILYGNSFDNTIYGNRIGTDSSGSFAIPNATGICIDDASHHNDIIDNLLSGNISYGMFIVTTGSDSNRVFKNKIGTNIEVNDTIPNDVGVLLGGGAKYNEIGIVYHMYGTTEGNIICGNRYAGIEVSDFGTETNYIQGNEIGIHYDGATNHYHAIANQIGIIIANNSNYNNIYTNVISSNIRYGITITDGASNSEVWNNIIGGSENSQFFGNGSCGILNGIGSNNNWYKQNEITHNDSSGIVIFGGNYNTISENLIFENSYLDIDIYPFGVNANDLGDSDTGPNDLLNYPVINSATYSQHSNPNFYNIDILGSLDTEHPDSCIIELFMTAPHPLLNHGGSHVFVTSTYSDSSGNWEVHMMKNISQFQNLQHITATATDKNGNTSEFSLNHNLILGIPEQNQSKTNIFPNPSDGNIKFNLELDQQSDISIEIFSVDGKCIRKTDVGRYTAGQQNINIDLDLPFGMYILKIRANNEIIGTQKLEIH